MGGCQNLCFLLGTLNIRCLIIVEIAKKDLNFDSHPYEVCLPMIL